RRGLRGATFYVHAGQTYAGVLVDKLECVLPLAGLGIGRQLAWYGRQAMKTVCVPALEIRQGERLLYSFAVPGPLLARFAAVCRVGRDEDGVVVGYQRPEVLAHIRQIKTYLEGEKALLPNRLVLAFDGPPLFASRGKGRCRLGQLEIPLPEEG